MHLYDLEIVGSAFSASCGENLEIENLEADHVSKNKREYR